MLMLTMQRAVGVYRLAMKDIVLSDGTHIPKGAMLTANSWHAQHDPREYEDPNAFDAFRFARLRDEDVDGAATRHQLVNTTAHFLPFGHGRHAWCVYRADVSGPTLILTWRIAPADSSPRWR